MTGHKAVFLDRDGVLNRSIVRDGRPYSPRRLEDFRLLPNTARSVRQLKDAGYLVVVVTNQPDIGNGFVSRELVDAMHEKLTARLPVDAVRLCPHSQGAGCDCRKPKPGMLLRAADEFGISLELSFMVGDRAGDIVAGQSAGCRSIFIDRGYSEARPTQADAEVSSLPAAVAHILKFPDMPIVDSSVP